VITIAEIRSCSASSGSPSRRSTTWGSSWKRWPTRAPRWWRSVGPWRSAAAS